jgi:UDP-N-acetylglucosamine 2-epimerase (non-hydrolysing)
MTTRILTIFGTRPEAIKMAPIVKRLKSSNVLDVTVCVTAQHRRLLDQVLALFDISPDFDLNIMRSDQGLCEVTSSILASLPRVFANCQPHWILVHGDTNSAFASALAAHYVGIPVGHVEAGLRSNDKRVPWPEEVNRKLTATIADLHFAPSKKAWRNLVNEGVPAQKILITGNTVVDALHHMLHLLGSDLLLARCVSKQFNFLDSERRLILVTGHRRESFNGGIECICDALARIAERPDIEIVFPVHPNPNVREPAYRILTGNKRIHLIDPLNYLSFVYLLNRAYLIITDSGGIQEEALSLAKPTLVTRTASDRPEALAVGTAELVGTDVERILARTNALLDDTGCYRRMSTAHQPYGDGKASERIVHYFERYVNT